jgi:hypothetical protein
VPANGRRLPLVFWHGHGQSAKTWETTPDGREGFQTIFLRRRFPVYPDRPAAPGPGGAQHPAGDDRRRRPTSRTGTASSAFGAWPDLYPGAQFSRDPEALNQFFRQMVPNAGPYEAAINTDAVSALFAKVGLGILVTHSQSGTLGWLTAIKSPNVRAIVSYEPGGTFVFPEGEAPAPMTHVGGTLTPTTVPRADFLKLTRIPIVVYYGDNIPEEPSANPGQDQWRTFRAMARLWRDTVNRHGGDVTLVELPKYRHSREHALPDVGPQQCRDRRPPLRLSCGRRGWIDRVAEMTDDEEGHWRRRRRQWRLAVRGGSAGLRRHRARHRACATWHAGARRLYRPHPLRRSVGTARARAARPQPGNVVSSLIAGGRSAQLTSHLRIGLGERAHAGRDCPK